MSWYRRINNNNDKLRKVKICRSEFYRLYFIRFASCFEWIIRTVSMLWIACDCYFVENWTQIVFRIFYDSFILLLMVQMVFDFFTLAYFLLSFWKLKSQFVILQCVWLLKLETFRLSCDWIELIWITQFSMVNDHLTIKSYVRNPFFEILMTRMNIVEATLQFRLFSEIEVVKCGKFIHLLFNRLNKQSLFFHLHQ